jgi:hypothetical protein
VTIGLLATGNLFMAELQEGPKRTFPNWTASLGVITAVASVVTAIAALSAVDTYRKSILLEARLSACSRIYNDGMHAENAVERIIEARERGDNYDVDGFEAPFRMVGDAVVSLQVIGRRDLSDVSTDYLVNLRGAQELSIASPFARSQAIVAIERSKAARTRLFGQCRSAFGMSWLD